MSLRELEDTWNLRKRGRRRERLVLGAVLIGLGALAFVLLLWIG